MSSAEPTVTRIDDVQVVGERINALIDASASGGVVARERAEELVRLVADLYGAAKSSVTVWSIETARTGPA